MHRVNISAGFDATISLFHQVLKQTTKEYGIHVQTVVNFDVYNRPLVYIAKCHKHVYNIIKTLTCLSPVCFSNPLGAFSCYHQNHCCLNWNHLMNLQHASTNHPCKLIYNKELLSCRFLRFYRAVKFGSLLWSKKILCMFQNINENIGTYGTGSNGWRKVHSVGSNTLVTPSHTGKHGHCHTG